MIRNYGDGLFRIWRVFIEFRLYEFSSFYIGFSLGRYIPLSLRLGWFEISFFQDDNIWEYDFCDEECCN